MIGAPGYLDRTNASNRGGTLATANYHTLRSHCQPDMRRQRGNCCRQSTFARCRCSCAGDSRSPRVSARPGALGCRCPDTCSCWPLSDCCVLPQTGTRCPRNGLLRQRAAGGSAVQDGWCPLRTLPQPRVSSSAVRTAGVRGGRYRRLRIVCLCGSDGWCPLRTRPQVAGVSAATGRCRLAGVRWWDAASVGAHEQAGWSGGRGAGRGRRSSPAG
jgi:hypothetical protein